MVEQVIAWSQTVNNGLFNKTGFSPKIFTHYQTFFCSIFNEMGIAMSIYLINQIYSFIMIKIKKTGGKGNKGPF